MRLRVHQERCTGCESCVLTCTFEHEDTFRLGSSRIQIGRNENDGIFRPMVCVQCPERFCVKGCPLGALTISPDLGHILVDREVCIGCGACEEACPYGGIRLSGDDEVPLVCDLCGGDPACVKVCRKPQALQLGGEEEEDHG